ncbi:hypothetical protein QTP70_001503 [Hemibagrus guttatus]|uniref:Pyridoxal phosphate homeostasis protein n=1 Tax=Hemibagrus guttatus TaxID=175788 RepID=A0AAE0QEC0_9TELE|nr:hypothetical protein QTP70_001503 [Hemibagrus guttatus]
MNAMWRVAMSEEVGKKMQAVVDRVNLAVTRRPKTLPCIAPRLVAVSKTKPPDMVVEAYKHGQRNFGENYVNEIVEKASHPLYKRHLSTTSNSQTPNSTKAKTKELSKDTRNKIVDLHQAGKTESAIDKHGLHPEETVNTVKHIVSNCPALVFSGLMTIGRYGYDLSEGPNPDFQILLKRREEVCECLNLPLEHVELSMGMSTDFEHAIEVGSTNIRVGSTIFGTREYPNTPSPSPEKKPEADCLLNLAMGVTVQ